MWAAPLFLDGPETQADRNLLIHTFPASILRRERWNLGSPKVGLHAFTEGEVDNAQWGTDMHA
jgi:hypothetical protein